MALSGETEKSSTMILDGLDIRQRLPMTRLPVMPQVLSRLFDACHTEAAGVDELTAIISLDSGIAAQVIDLAAALPMDDRDRPATLRECVALAGLNAIKTISVNESASRVFGKANERQEFAPAHAHYWFRALNCALLARMLATSMHYPDPEEAYLAGLMHDVGSLALAAIDPNSYSRLLYQNQGEEYMCRFELARYQASHADIGAWIADSWQLNSFLSDSIRYHHVPAERVATAHPLIRISLLANRLLRVAPASDQHATSELARLCGVAPAIVEPSIRWAAEEANRIAREHRIDTGIITIDASPPLTLTSPAPEPSGELETRLAEKLLLDSAQAALGAAENLDAGLKEIAQTVLVFFGLQPCVFFLREGTSETFSGRAWLPRHTKVNQLKFMAGQTDSVASQATQGTPATRFLRDCGQRPLDAQLARLLGAEGVICIPMGAGPQCKGVIVSAIHSQHQADVLHEKFDLMRSLGRLAGTLLQKVAVSEKPAPPAAEMGASREQIRHLLHEVSNPLSVVRNYLSVLELNAAENPESKKGLRMVAEEISRVSHILEQFQQSPQETAVTCAPLALQDLVQGVLDLCAGSGLVPPQLTIETHFHAAPATRIANPDKLKQVLLNLMKNAFEAMPGGGSLRLSTAPWSDGSNGSHVELTIEDTGPGLPEEIRPHLFQPVTSTKGGRHFGIGLSIVSQLVREMAGLITCRSTPQGTCFRIILPVVTP